MCIFLVVQGSLLILDSPQFGALPFYLCHGWESVFGTLIFVLPINILVKGTTQGTTNNFDGNFEISIENQEKAIFTVKAVGFQPQDVPVNGRNNLMVTLKEDITELNEVVVRALGVKREEKYSS